MPARRGGGGPEIRRPLGRGPRVLPGKTREGIRALRRRGGHGGSSDLRSEGAAPGLLPAGEVPAGAGRCRGRGGERREGAVDREGTGGTGWIHQGNPVRGEQWGSRGYATASDEYP